MSGPDGCCKLRVLAFLPSCLTCTRPGTLHKCPLLVHDPGMPCTQQPHTLAAGMEEGGVCAWDLSEPAGSHPQEQMGGSCWTARRPAYTTEAHVMLKDALVEPVVDVAAAASASTSTGSCQLVCLSDSGRVVVYAMQMLASSQAAAAAASDLGMRPGSLLRLVSSGAGEQSRRQCCFVRTAHATDCWLCCSSREAALHDHHPSQADMHGFAGVRLGRAAAQPVYGLEPSTPCPHLSAACLALIPGQGTELLVGAGQGTVLRGAWFGLPGLPRQFAAQEWRPPLAALTTNASTALPGVFVGVEHCNCDAACGLFLKLSRKCSCTCLRSASNACTLKQCMLFPHCGPCAAEGGGLAKPGGLPSWASSQVVSLALSPACPDAFLAAHSCGTLALHTTRRSGAALVWRGWCGAQRLAAVRCAGAAGVQCGAAQPVVSCLQTCGLINNLSCLVCALESGVIGFSVQCCLRSNAGGAPHGPVPSSCWTPRAAYMHSTWLPAVQARWRCSQLAAVAAEPQLVRAACRWCLLEAACKQGSSWASWPVGRRRVERAEMRCTCWALMTGMQSGMCCRSHWHSQVPVSWRCCSNC